jgi:hypothetical protein
LLQGHRDASRTNTPSTDPIANELSPAQRKQITAGAAEMTLR